MLTERQREYRRWLNSPEWAAIRERAFAVHGDRCVSCGGQPVQFHHVFYPKDWNDTRPEHLLAICEWHHIVVESRDDKGRTRDEAEIPALVAALLVEMKEAPDPPPPPEFSTCETFMRDLSGDMPMIGLDAPFLKWLAQSSVGEGYRQWVVDAFRLEGDLQNWLQTAVGRWITIDRWWEALRQHREAAKQMAPADRSTDA